MSKKSLTIHWAQAVITIVLSLLLLFSCTILLSKIWPAEVPTERMAAGAILSSLLWAVFMCIGCLAKNSWRALGYLGGLLVLTTGVSVAMFLPISNG